MATVHPANKRGKRNTRKISKQTPAKAARQSPVYYPTADSEDVDGYLIKIGDRVLNTDDGLETGIVQAVFGRHIIYMPEYGRFVGEWASQVTENLQVLHTFEKTSDRLKYMSAVRVAETAFMERKAEGRKAMDEHEAKWKRERRGQHRINRSFEEFIDDANNLLNRLKAYATATKPLRANVERAPDLFVTHGQHFGDLIEDVLAEASDKIDTRNPNAKAEWQAVAFHLFRKFEPTDRYRPSAPVSHSVLDERSVDKDGSAIELGDRVEDLDSEGAGTVIFIASDKLVYVNDADGDTDYLGDIVPTNCRTCRILVRRGERDDGPTLINTLHNRGQQVRAERKALKDRQSIEMGLEDRDSPCEWLAFELHNGEWRPSFRMPGESDEVKTITEVASLMRETTLTLRRVWIAHYGWDSAVVRLQEWKESHPEGA